MTYRDPNHSWVGLDPTLVALTHKAERADAASD